MIECMSQKLEMSVQMSTIFVLSATINATVINVIIKNDENQFHFLIKKIFKKINKNYNYFMRNGVLLHKSLRLSA